MLRRWIFWYKMEVSNLIIGQGITLKYFRICSSWSRVPFDKDDNSSIKVLDLLYNPSRDIFSYRCSPSEKSCTKRNILSEIERIFDSLGLFSPVSFLAKHVMQRLWNSGVGWDETLSQAICDLWYQHKSELSIRSQICLPQYVVSEKVQRCQLLGFCDASGLGYACAVYIRIELPELHSEIFVSDR